MMVNLNQTRLAGLFLGLALRRVFPQEEYLGHSISPVGFYAEIRHKEPFQESFLPLIHQAMKDLIAEEPQMRHMEMVASNAVSFLDHRGYHALSKTLTGVEGTVGLVEVGDHIDLFEGPTAEVGTFFELYQFHQDKNVVRIYGVVLSDHKAQNRFRKALRTYDKRQFRALAHQLDLFDSYDDEWIWHPRGQSLYRLLEERWLDFLKERGIDEVRIDPKLEAKYAKSAYAYLTEKTEPILSLYPSRRQQAGCVCIHSNKGVDAITTLIILTEEFSKSLLLKGEWVLFTARQEKKNNHFRSVLKKKGAFFQEEDGHTSDARLVWHIPDGLGRYWPMASLAQVPWGARANIVGSFESLIAHLLENSLGDFPPELIPEHVRLITEDGVDIEPLMQTFTLQKKRFFVDKGRASRGEKVQRALRTKVPYVIVFGKQEENAGKICCIAYGSNKEKKLTFDELSDLITDKDPGLESQ